MIQFPAILFALIPIVLLAYTINTMTGFGASLIAVSIGATFMPVDKLIPVLLPLSVAVSGTIALRHWRLIAPSLLIKQILPFMGGGMIAGLAIYPLLKGTNLKAPLGIMVVVFSAKELAFLCMAKQPQGKLSRAVVSIWQVMAGVIHAIYTTGGPLLVYSVNRLDLEKGVFRSTLSSVWCILNLVLLIIFLLNGRLTAESLSLSAPLLPLLPIGIFMGEWLHKRVSARIFQMAVCSLLICTGIRLIL